MQPLLRLEGDAQDVGVDPLLAAAQGSLHGGAVAIRPGGFSQHEPRLEAAGILGSMGSVGDALDNAVAESFFATLQTELLNRGPWPTRQILKTAIFEYVEGFYNRHRRHSALGYLSPDEFERRWYLDHEVPVTAA